MQVQNKNVEVAFSGIVQQDNHVVQDLVIAVFASGRGSNLRSIAAAVQSGEISHAHLALVISDNNSAGAFVYASEKNIPAVHISRTQFDSDKEYALKLLELLQNFNINFIVLAGYLKKLDSLIIEKFRNRIINIHPALLPEFGGKGMYGIHVHEAVIASGKKHSGATVHLVDDEYDHGTILMQEQVEVQPHDTPKSLAEKVLAIEHRLYPKVIGLIAENKMPIDDTGVMINAE